MAYGCSRLCRWATIEADKWREGEAEGVSCANNEVGSESTSMLDAEKAS